VFTIAADGVYVSQNFGASWKLTSIPEHLVTNSASLLDVEVSRANPNIVWAGSGMNNNTNEERHLFVSTDGGTTFSETNNFSGALLGSITKLASHPTEPNTAYALFSFADRPKILRTTDLGQTWKDLSGFGANTSSNNGFPDVATFCLYVRPDDPSILWAGTEIGIFESLDEGQSWSLIPDFPKVAVWDMKGQDNQVVISTHGRGIWTATLPSAQSDFIGAAKIAAAGMAPREALAIRVMIGIDADSVSVFVDKNLNRTIKNITAGTHDYFIKGLAKGNRNIHLITYESGAPFLSPTVTAPVIDLGTVKTNYSTTFSSASEFSLEELTLQRIHAKQNNLSLKTGSPYKNNSTYSALLTEPIKISATLPKLFYKDIRRVARDVRQRVPTRHRVRRFGRTRPRLRKRAPQSVVRPVGFDGRRLDEAARVDRPGQGAGGNRRRRARRRPHAGRRGGRPRRGRRARRRPRTGRPLSPQRPYA
jgi:hypothetical protein